MNNGLPDNWALATIGNVTCSPEQRQPKLDEDFLYIDISSIDRETKKIINPQRLAGNNAPSRARQVVRTGDVLVSMTRPNLNAVAMVSHELDGNIASTGFDVLRSIEVEPRWLFNLVRAGDFVAAMSELVQGALYPAVRPRDIRGFEIPLAPLNEQKRITDKLDSMLAQVDSCRERLDRIPLILKRFRQAVLSAATSGQLTEACRKINKYQEPETGTLGEWCDVLGGKRLPKGFELTDVPTKYPYIRVTDFDRFSIKESQIKFVPVEAYPQISRYIINDGDIYISIAGTIGNVGQVPPSLSGANLTENAARILVRQGIVPCYLMYQLASPELQAQMNEKKIATTQDKLGLFRIKELEITKPSLEEQHEIVRRVDTLFAFADRLEARYTDARKQVDQLTPSLLAKAFRGELVPQDPADEPAEKLLDRIRAERLQTVPALRRTTPHSPTRKT